MELRYTEDAMADLIDIGQFIARNNRARAFSFTEELSSHCQTLVMRPLSRPVVKEIGDDVRRSVFGNYNIYYLVNDDYMVIFGIIEGHRRQAQVLEGRTFK